MVSVLSGIILFLFGAMVDPGLMRNKLVCGTGGLPCGVVVLLLYIMRKSPKMCIFWTDLLDNVALKLPI
jgi:hypothetical protein